MSSPNQRRGINFERRVKKYLESRGFEVTRSAGSFGPHDLVAKMKNNILNLQCKKTSKEVMYLYDLTPGKNNYLVYAFNYSPIYIKQIKKTKTKIIKLQEHTKLEDFLKVNYEVE